MLTPQSSPTNLSAPKKKVVATGACSHFEASLPGDIDLVLSVSKEAMAEYQDSGYESEPKEGARRLSNIRLIIPEESYEVNWILNIFDPNVTSMNDVFVEEKRSGS